MSKRTDETWHRLREWTAGQAPSERLAAQILLAEGFTDLDPSHPLGGPDAGKDAVACRGGRIWVMAVYFPRGQQRFSDIRRKFVADFHGMRANDADGMVFVTNQELTLAERTGLSESVAGETDIYHLERLVAVLDQPRMAGVRSQFLSIDAPAVMAVVTRMGEDAAGGDVFVGRDAEVEQVLSILAPGAAGDGVGRVLVSAVAGMGGIGKTALARHTAAIAVGRKWFLGGVFWVDLQGYNPEGQVHAEAVFAPLLRHLGVPGDQVPDTAGEQAAVYNQLLTELAAQHRRVLLVLDNAATATQLHGLLPGAGPHRVVVTTRDTLAIPSARRLALDVLDSETAVAVLDEAVREQDPDDDRISGDHHAAAELARVCGWLPLALRIAAALLADTPHLTVPELAADLAVAPIDGFAHGETAMASVFTVSWRRLQARSPEAARLLCLLTVIPGPELATDAAAAVVGQTEPVTRVHLRTLCQAHLLQAQAGGRWRIHDLIRRYTVDHAVPALDPDDIAAAIQRLLFHFTSTAEAAAAYLDARPGKLVIDRFTDREEALAWLDTEYPSLVGAVHLAAAEGDFLHTNYLAGFLGPYQQWRRRLEDHITTARLAYFAAQQLTDHTPLAMAINNLGLALRNARRFEEAITVLREAVGIYQQAGDARRAGESWINLGAALHEAGQWEEALSAFHAARDLLQENEDPYVESRAWTGLGATLRSAGRWEEAITAHRTARDLTQKTGDSRGEGMTWNNLGVTLRGAGQWEEAVVAYRAALDCFRGTGDFYNEGLAWNGIGAALGDGGQWAESVTAHHTARDLIQETGDLHSEGTVELNLGRSLIKIGRLQDGISSTQTAIERFRETKDDRNEGAAWDNLGTAFMKMGQGEKAVSAHRTACDLMRKTGNLREEGFAWRGMGFALWEVGRYEEAVNAQCRHLVICQQTRNRHDEGRAWGLLATRLAQLDQFEEACDCCDEATAAFRDTDDPGWAERIRLLREDIVQASGQGDSLG